MKREAFGTAYRDRQGNWMTHYLTHSLNGATKHNFATTRSQDEALVVTDQAMNKDFRMALVDAETGLGMSAVPAKLITERIVEVDVPDKLMSIEELQYRYGRHLGNSEERKRAEHPMYPVADWMQDINESVHPTRLGYWDWVIEKLNEE